MQAEITTYTEAPIGHSPWPGHYINYGNTIQLVIFVQQKFRSTQATFEMLISL